MILIFTSPMEESKHLTVNLYSHRDTSCESTTHTNAACLCHAQNSLGSVQ